MERIERDNDKVPTLSPEDQIKYHLACINAKCNMFPKLGSNIRMMMLLPHVNGILRAITGQVNV